MEAFTKYCGELPHFLLKVLDSVQMYPIVDYDLTNEDAFFLQKEHQSSMNKLIAEETQALYIYRAPEYLLRVEAH